MSRNLDWEPRVGMRVVCIYDGVWRHRDTGESFPTFGGIYTIRCVCERSGDVMLLLQEIVNPPRHYKDGFLEASFRASVFRPLEERKTDISIFREILRTADQRIEEEA